MRSGADADVEHALLLALLDPSEEARALRRREAEAGELPVRGLALGLVADDLEDLAVRLEARVQELVVDAARGLVVPGAAQDEERVLVAHGVRAPVVRAERDGVDP